MSLSVRAFSVPLIFILLAIVLPSVALADAKKLLFDAHQKMLDSRVAIDTVSTDAKGKETKMRTEYDTIERVRVLSDDVGLVILPEGMWMRNGKGEWRQPPIDMSGMLKQFLPRTIEDVRASTTNIVDEGQKTIDGRSLRAISFDTLVKVMGISSSSHTTVYINADGRIVRSEADAVAMRQKTRAVQEIRYDDSIRVTAPN